MTFTSSLCLSKMLYVTIDCAAKVNFPSHGYYEIWARATDKQGVSQPFAVAWNPKGYMNNAMHRIAVLVPQA